jgi:23S rRNA (uracil1939-C5)-methyltransferase
MAVCKHFGVCGGCTSQDMEAAAYADAKREAVVTALARAGLGDTLVEQPISVPPRSRRRAVFKIKSLPEGLHIGFHAARSHTIVDMHQCEILTPDLFALVEKLRGALEPLFGVGEAAELHVTECENGFDAAFRWRRKLTPALVATLSRALTGSGIVRLVLDGEMVFETAAPVVQFGAIRASLPPHAFLQPTRQGEALLQQKVLALTGKAKTALDLFAGLGTFTLPLAAKMKVHAVEQDRAMLNAMIAAAKASPGLKPVTSEVRDLFRVPLSPPELGRFDAVVLDPPRAGAEAQSRALAASKVRQIVYVSCNADSFARDAAILAAGSFSPGPVTPVDQFLWSSHIELVASFTRSGR